MVKKPPSISAFLTELELLLDDMPKTTSYYAAELVIRAKVRDYFDSFEMPDEYLKGFLKVTKMILEKSFAQRAHDKLIIDSFLYVIHERLNKDLH